jgi:hypothetical protein
MPGTEPFGASPFARMQAEVQASRATIHRHGDVTLHDCMGVARSKDLQVIES